ncbi:MAG TPA: molybdenum cofactor biosynthesis protein MoaE [Candidatus Polarisedimenticolaceae bacterium]|nr:molybdenum cofactor biosynthesis protein MoaE [Candidatus Polarisedimenticolaceae bacterium]
MILLARRPIDVAELLQAVGGPGNGAVALFVGTVREQNQGRRVLHLEYHAYDEMALREMSALRQAALERFALGEVAIAHRIGKLEVGEASVAIAVSAPHRAASFDACRWIIDRLKQRVPIWKKEFFEGGEVWIEGPN